MRILAQNTNTVEIRTVLTAAMLQDIPVTRSDIGSLATHQELYDNSTLPVGSVEFVRQVMSLKGITEPASLSYPVVLSSYLHRAIDSWTIADLNCHITDNGAPVFIKPQQTKLFTGFVFDPVCPSDRYDQHDMEQLLVMRLLPPATKLWASDVVSLVSEYRYYVQDQVIIGSARYDQNEAEDVPEPDRSVILRAITDLGLGHPYTMDFGVTSEGTTILVECNDAWAIGLYDKALTPKQYLDFLGKRWIDIIQ